MDKYKLSKADLGDLTDEQINELPHEEFVDRVFKRLKEQPALIAETDIGEVDRWLLEDKKGPARRAALLLLSKPGAWVLEHVPKTREGAVAFAEMAEHMREYSEALKELTALLERAYTRIILALCMREDMEAIFAQAEASFQGDTPVH